MFKQVHTIYSEFSGCWWKKYYLKSKIVGLAGSSVAQERGGWLEILCVDSFHESRTNKI